MSEQEQGDWNLNGVKVSVNGEERGTAQASDTLAATVQFHLRGSRIQTASVFAGDGRKLNPADGSKTLQALGVFAINIVTKDSRA